MVTGGAGFIGSTLVDRLLAEDHVVDVVDDLSAGSVANLAGARAAGGRQLSIHQLDARSADLVTLAQRRRPEVVYHLAAPPRPADPFDDPAADVDRSLVATLRVLQACQRAGATKVVTAVGAAVYGDVDRDDLPVREGHALRPLAPPAVVERASLDYLHAYRVRFELEYTAVVLGNVYGPRQDPACGAVAAVFADRLATGRACPVHGSGAQTRDFVFVDDVVDALARAGTRGGGLVINVATGQETSITDLHGMMSAAAGTHGPVEVVTDAPVGVRRLALDPGRAAIQLGWRPWTGVVEGVGATLEWARSVHPAP